MTEEWVTPDGRTAVVDVATDGTVQVSIELLRQMLTDLGLVRKEDA